LYEQLDQRLDDAYSHAIEEMARGSQLDDAKEGMAAFMEKRRPKWADRA
jgi:enoyl-CoA hydratase/carnithine racemase